MAINDFIVSAYLTKTIILNSKGNAWRPFIDVNDMCKAIHWALLRKKNNGSKKLLVNVGSNDQNYIIKNIARKIAALIPNSKVLIKENALSDKRSYQVNFDLYSQLVDSYLPSMNIVKTTNNILNQLNEVSYNDINFRESKLIRLNAINKLISQNLLTDDLNWHMTDNQTEILK